MATKCDLNNPEQVKTEIATRAIEESTKKKLVDQYNSYIKFLGKTWKKPIYKPKEHIPFIPTEAELDQLITSYRKKTATILILLKETGARIGEAKMLKWTDINLENKTVSITPEKGSNPRILPISDKLITLLNHFPKTRETLLPKSLHGFRSNFDDIRKQTADKVQNPRLKKISFHTFRHYKGTMEYHKTKDIMHVKYVLGHKDIKATLIYINIEQAIFLQDTDEWTAKIAHTEQEAIQLIEAGFQFVNNIGTAAIYKKRK